MSSGLVLSVVFLKTKDFMDAQPAPAPSPNGTNGSGYYHPTTLTPTHNHKRWLERSPEFLRKHELRNFKIVRMYAQEPITMRAIGLKFGLSEGRIKAIIAKYAGKLDWDLRHEKTKRVNELRRIADETQAPGMKLAVVRELREEFEGKSSGVSVNVSNNVSVNMTMLNLAEKLHASRISSI